MQNPATAKYIAFEIDPGDKVQTTNNGLRMLDMRDGGTTVSLAFQDGQRSYGGR